MTETTIYSARKIITMNPNQPEVSHVAVRDGRILGAGSLEELACWGEHVLDERFADKVLMPGFVEGHAHTMEGTLWTHTYCGFFDRMDPEGKVWPGAKTIDEVLARLRETEATLPEGAPLPGWQLDPIYMDNAKVSREQLDSVSDARPIGVLHASGHIMNVNSKALEMAGLLKTGINHPGIPLGDDGMPTGELKGPEAYMPVSELVGFDRDALACDEPGLKAFGKLCVRTGTTTITDLAARLGREEAVPMMLRVTGADDYPARVVPLRFFLGLTPEELIAEAKALKELSTDRLRLGMIKVVADGSIQGFSARLRWPGYHNGAPNGLWYITPEHLSQIYNLALEEGLHIHTHTNGDQATELVLDTLEEALRAHPNPDHRYTLQHCQLADAGQFRRMKALGMCVNLFANHHFYWGDEHYRLTVGPERALRMNACRTALDTGVPMAIHSDAPVTPLGPLFTAWCAVNRITASGRVQGEGERISVDEALYAITIGAAYTLKLDGEVGSIEVGKHADFAVLEEDPREVDPMALKDVKVWGTVQAGRVFAAADL